MRKPRAIFAGKSSSSSSQDFSGNHFHRKYHSKSSPTVSLENLIILSIQAACLQHFRPESAASYCQQFFFSRKSFRNSMLLTSTATHCFQEIALQKESSRNSFGEILRYPCRDILQKFVPKNPTAVPSEIFQCSFILQYSL